jgi:hypothetical protein
MTSQRVLAVNTVHEIVRGPTRYTAIDKRPVTGTVARDDRQTLARGHGLTRRGHLGSGGQPA